MRFAAIPAIGIFLIMLSTVLRSNGFRAEQRISLASLTLGKCASTYYTMGYSSPYTGSSEGSGKAARNRRCMIMNSYPQSQSNYQQSRLYSMPTTAPARVQVKTSESSDTSTYVQDLNMPARIRSDNEIYRNSNSTDNIASSLSSSSSGSDNKPDNDDTEYLIPVKVVNTKEEAVNALQVLKAHPHNVWACDTEVADIDVKNEGPVGNGEVICVSIFGGEDVDFGGGMNTLWINNDGSSRHILQVFKDWFEDEAAKKVWHNYGFDRHVMYNEGIDCKGFFGDTMHMARLHDTGRDKASNGVGKGYSLESLSSSFYKNDPRFAKTGMKELFGVPRLRKDGTESKIKELPGMRELQNGVNTRAKWIEYSARDAVATWWVWSYLVKRLKSMGWQVNGVALPQVDGEKPNMYHFYLRYLRDFGELLTDMERNGIKLDTDGHLKKAEFAAREERQRLENMFLQWAEPYCEEIRSVNIASSAQMGQLLFGEWSEEQRVSKTRLFKMDRTEEEYQAACEQILKQNPYAAFTGPELKTILKERGLKATAKNKEEQLYRLLKYDVQKQELLARGADALEELCTMRGLDCSGGVESMAALYLASEAAAASKEIARLKREKNKLKKQQEAAAAIAAAAAEQGELDAAVLIQEQENSVGVPSISEENGLVNGEEVVVFASEAERIQEESLRTAARLSMPKRSKEIEITTIGLEPASFTPTGTAQVSAAVLKKLAGKNIFGDESEAQWGTAYEFFEKSEGEGKGKEACRAIGALAAVGQIDATITNFLVPLQALVDKNKRIHCSLNLNTETGRLSSRRPNLQNQPALEKDQYKIRDAFIAEKGKTFIVADYGQLELRILAHISACESMITAFREGGCFHSRTAMGMYEHIKKAVDSGEVMLEWDYSKGQPTVPLVKDTYASERRKAKTLNFSIAYGKTVHGLASDWGISKEEAQETLDAWYRDRPEVKGWQENTQNWAKRHGFVRTVMGRYRRLDDAKEDFSGRGNGAAMGHALRAAINTPIQGSAADIVMMAMIKLWKSDKLKSLGWKLLLQIHDEVIMEGPKETMEEAMQEVRDCMEHPFDDVLEPLQVHLDVDAKSADSWYKAK